MTRRCLRLRVLPERAAYRTPGPFPSRPPESTVDESTSSYSCAQMQLTSKSALLCLGGSSRGGVILSVNQIQINAGAGVIRLEVFRVLRPWSAIQHFFRSAYVIRLKFMRH